MIVSQKLSKFPLLIAILSIQFPPYNCIFRFWAFFIGLGMLTNAHSQIVEAKLDFQSDTFAVGKEVILALNIEHPDTMSVFFPPKMAFIGAFEILKEEDVSTKTQQHRSTDTRIYTLQCFEVAKTQHVYLPYRYIENGDTIVEQASSDTIELRERVATKDSLARLNYRASHGILMIKDPLNLYLIGVVLLGALFILILIILSLRKPILRYLRRQMIQREWSNIKRQLQKLQTQSQNQSFYLDELNKIWKETFGKAYNLPLRSLTTSELVPVLSKHPDFSDYQKQVLTATAQASDKVIYAGISLPTTEIVAITEGVRQVLEDFFRDKLSAVIKI